MAKKAKIKAEKRFSLGVDYGTNSVRALIVDVADGSEIAGHVYNYRRGAAGILLDAKDPNLARQDAADYIEGFVKAVRGAVRAAAKEPGFSAQKVIGIGIDTTGSTPAPAAWRAARRAYAPNGGHTPNVTPSHLPRGGAVRWRLPARRGCRDCRGRGAPPRPPPWPPGQ